jgi:tRNA (guanine-N7-)-methyltransferase
MANDIKKYLPSFGRTHGRVLKVKKQEVMDNLLPTLLITPEEVSALEGTVHLEIGYGNGEHICHRASENPDITFIGCEVYDSGIATCLKEIEDKNITNIRMYTEDARILMESIPDHFLDKIYLLFPDPWPKTRHHKRRIVNQDMLGFMHRVLKPNAELAIGTDHHLYAQWMMVHIDRFSGFEWTAEQKSDWRDIPNGHILTRYQQKNKAETDYPIFLNYKKL